MAPLQGKKEERKKAVVDRQRKEPEKPRRGVDFGNIPA